MKVALALLWILTAAGAFAAGRLWAPVGGDAQPPSVSSFEEALGTRDELERAHRMSAFLRAMGPAELPGALRAIQKENIGVTREEVRLLMLAWSRFDAPGAFEWARAWPTQWSKTLMEQAIYAWGFRDAPAAVEALQKVEDSELQERLRRALVEGWVHGDDRAGATEYIAAVSHPRQRGRFAFLLAAEAMRDGPDALMRWAESVPESAPNDFKRGAFHQAATMVARQDPHRAAAWFEAHRMHAYTGKSLEGIALSWAEQEDPPALFDWLRGLSLEGERAQEPADAIAAGFRVWAQRDPAAAEAWLEAALPDPALDPAIAELVRLRTSAAPDAALGWAARIEGDDLRLNATIRAARTWRRRDPQAFDAWLARSDLPEELRQAILGPAARPARGGGPADAPPLPR